MLKLKRCHSVPIQKDSELLPLFNYYCTSMHQGGILHFLQRKWLLHREPVDRCGCNLARESAAAAPLGYENMLLPFLFFAGGAAAAMLGASLEWAAGAGWAARRPVRRMRKYVTKSEPKVTMWKDIIM